MFQNLNFALRRSQSCKMGGSGERRVHYEGGSDTDIEQIPIIDQDPIIHELGDDIINLGFWIQ